MYRGARKKKGGRWRGGSQRGRMNASANMLPVGLSSQQIGILGSVPSNPVSTIPFENPQHNPGSVMSMGQFPTAPVSGISALQMGLQSQQIRPSNPLPFPDSGSVGQFPMYQDTQPTRSEHAENYLYEGSSIGFSSNATSSLGKRKLDDSGTNESVKYMKMFSDDETRRDSQTGSGSYGGGGDSYGNSGDSYGNSGDSYGNSGDNYVIDITGIDDSHGDNMPSNSGSHGDGGGRDKGESKREGTSDNRIQKKVTLDEYLKVNVTPEQILSINKEKIRYEGELTANSQFVCTLCQAFLNSEHNLEKHLGTEEHSKKIKFTLMENKEDFLWCGACCVLCNTEEVYEAHVKGKKHLRNLNCQDRIKKKKTFPIGDHLDSLFKEVVIDEGTGATLGITPSMMKFLDLEGPLIGLQYAQEIGYAGKTAPIYKCTLCKVKCDPGNQHLHFLSSAHRMSVLQKDYPEKHAVLKEFGDGRMKGEFNSILKEVVAEIEKKEGRTIKVIQRKILAPPTIAKGKVQRGGGRGRGKDEEKGGFFFGPGVYSSADFVRGGKGKGKGGGGGGNKERGRGHGGYRGRGRGIGGRGSYGGAQDSQYGSREPYGGRRGVSNQWSKGDTARSGSAGGPGWNQKPDWSMQSQERSGGQWESRDRNYGDGGQWEIRDRNYGGQQWESRDRNYGGGGGQWESRDRSYSGQWENWDRSYGGGGQWEDEAHYYGSPTSYSGGPSGDRTQAFKALASTIINSEDEAEQAFQLSSALTQALLEYRMKSLNSVSPFPRGGRRGRGRVGWRQNQNH